MFTDSWPTPTLVHQLVGIPSTQRCSDREACDIIRDWHARRLASEGPSSEGGGILTQRPGFDVSRRVRNLQQLRRVNKAVCFRMLLVHWAVTWREKLEFPTGLLKKFFCFPCGGKCRLARGSPLCNIDPETYFQILRADKQKYPITDRHDFQNHHWGW